MHAFLHWLHGFRPAPTTASRRERILGCVGAALGLWATEVVARHALGELNPWFIAPMGASAVLLFAVPASPLAQPWSIVGGNLIAACVGVAAGLLLGHTGFAAAVAAAIAIALMFEARCIHPPSGAVALTAVLGGPAVYRLGFGFVLWPVLLDSLLLLAYALLFNNALQRRYPHRISDRANVNHQVSPPLPAGGGVTRDDLRAVLSARGELVDISEEDLEEIIYAAEMRALFRASRTTANPPAA
ncbi:HPP family protein [Amantichitinum ursilacus]|uniref:HPP family protein n=1 Tax=Amantichitinum ursilacus TaxID=857265 RepID=A0A0N0GLW1_9NEIS|nr:HPP family protein [Amantichitinum ursilacus]KPC50496.1 HPP family protein [Amantichitinum ursilacus]